MDGLPGLEKVFQEEFNNAKIQRCQVHVAREDNPQMYYAKFQRK